MSDLEDPAAVFKKQLDLKALKAAFDASLEATYASRFEILPAPFEGHIVLAIGAAAKIGFSDTDGGTKQFDEVRIKSAFIINKAFAERLVEKLSAEFELSGPKPPHTDT
ncbi:MAG: hypothetical protein LPL29_08840 [Alphaproteobacteria bacterium]|nr:hypothetical protein [Alphaproteobacteria bacterium]MDX5369473.1 hypothetical protein [Alphaproteobacteria bacterium]